jgi:hypothetical protein
MKKTLYLLTVTLIFLTGCSKDPNLLSLESKTDNIGLAKATNALPTVPLDWEHIDYMPTPPNATPIPVPWQSGLGGRNIDDDVVYDYAKADGWKLVYNTFNTTSVTDIRYFMLYNKYRGILRSYFYLAPGSNFPSSYINHNLSLSGITNSSILNYSGKDLIDLNDGNTRIVSQMQPFQISTTGSWYAADFEMAYDPNATNTSYQNMQLSWKVNAIDVSTVSLNGLETGSISGTIEQKQASGNFFSNLSGGLVDGVVKAGNKMITDTASKHFLKFLRSPIVAAIETAVVNGGAGLIKGFLSGILGGNTAHPVQQTVSLNINSRITTTGTVQHESNIFSNVFALPGTLNIQNNGPFYPAFTNTLGVVSISNNPTVKLIASKRSTGNEYDPGTILSRFSYTLQPSTFTISYNPSILNVATITNKKVEMIMPGPPHSAIDYLSATGSQYRTEDIGGLTYYAPKILGNSSALVFEYTTDIDINQAAQEPVYVRISFDIVPNDGAPKSTIVKTIKANVALAPPLQPL